MGNSIGDQLLKMGLVDEKKVRQSEHDRRVQNKKKGRAGLAADRQARQSSASDRRASEREADRSRELGKNEGLRREEIERQVDQIINSDRVSFRTDGRKRFYYESHDDRVPYVQVNDETMDALSRGKLALVGRRNGQAQILSSESAQRVSGLLADRIIFWNG